MASNVVVSLFKLEERDWKIRSTKVDTGDFKNELLNPLRLTVAVNVLRWVHTCNVTAYHTAVTLQVTDTIWSYDLNYHPIPHGITLSYEGYTMGYPVCYKSQKHHECKEGESSGWWWRVTLQIETCSSRNRIIPLMQWPNTDSAPNNVTMQLPTFDTLHGYESYPHSWSGGTVCSNVTSMYPPLSNALDIQHFLKPLTVTCGEIHCLAVMIHID
jgi:hypothetical protein